MSIAQEKISSIYWKVNSLNHQRDSDLAFFSAKEIASELAYAVPQDENIRRDIKMLDRYQFDLPEAKKDALIQKFKQQVMDHLVVYQ